MPIGIGRSPAVASHIEVFPKARRSCICSSPRRWTRGVLEYQSFDELKTNGLKATLPRLKVLDVFQQASVRHLVGKTSTKSSWPKARTSV